jgi:hypothetical protein
LSAEKNSRFVFTMIDNGLNESMFLNLVEQLASSLETFKNILDKEKENALQGKSFSLCIDNLSFQDFASYEKWNEWCTRKSMRNFL